MEYSNHFEQSDTLQAAFRSLFRGWAPRPSSPSAWENLGRFTTVLSSIWCSLVATWSRHTTKVNLLLLFGERILSVDVDGNMFIWAFKGIDQNHAPIGHILLEEKFNATCIMHPDTYLNKVTLGSQEGPLQLWNISTKKKLYEFKGWKSSICCCVSSPALDVVAVGCADGKIHVQNISYDEEIVTFMHSSRGAVMLYLSALMDSHS